MLNVKFVHEIADKAKARKETWIEALRPRTKAELRTAKMEKVKASIQKFKAGFQGVKPATPAKAAQVKKAVSMTAQQQQKAKQVYNLSLDTPAATATLERIKALFKQYNR